VDRAFLEFQALGMPANAMVGDMLISRVRANPAAGAEDLFLLKTVLLSEYGKYCAARLPGVSVSTQESVDSDAAVEVYSKPTCPYTRALRRKLERDGVIYVEHNVESSPALLKQMLELNGGRRSVPTMRSGDDIVVGFHGT
jgi:glutaredoxin